MPAPTPSALSALCGHLLVVGIDGHDLADAERRALAEGRRAGVVLFRRNVAEALANVPDLNRAIAAAMPKDSPALVAVDQEGGRVARLGAPAMKLPPMRRLGDLGDLDLVRRVAEAQARELRALGFTMSFAPVADIHTRPENPIIGDRAFASTAEEVAARAGAFAEGLTKGGILSCAKHFPGHGDTMLDSHLALPRVDRPKADLEAIEIAPFRALAKTVDSMMTAHVVYPALDDVPATLSQAVCTDLLRGTLGFEGVLFSDDLEMKAIAEPAMGAVLAIAAGCDVLLVCSRADLADAIHEALVREAERSGAFRARCEEAAARSLAMRRKAPPSPSDPAAAFRASEPIVRELAERLG